MLLVTLGIRLVWRDDFVEIGGFLPLATCLAAILTGFGWLRSYRSGFLVMTALNLVLGLITIASYLRRMDEMAYGIAWWNINLK